MIRLEMIKSFLGSRPRYDQSNFIAPSADLIGDVTLGKNTSVWFHVTIRADVNWIRIGDESNVQDNSVIHVTRQRWPTQVGNGVTIGHSVTLHGCTVADNVLVGMGAVILDGAVIGEDSIVGARSLITQGTLIPAGSLVLGSPARVVRTLSQDEVETIRRNGENYLEYSAIYLGNEKPDKNPFY